MNAGGALLNAISVITLNNLETQRNRSNPVIASEPSYFQPVNTTLLVKFHDSVICT